MKKTFFTKFLNRIIKIVLFIFVFIFIYSAIPDDKQLSVRNNFELTLKIKWKPFFRDDTLNYTINQKYIKNPNCNSIIYFEFSSLDSSTIFIDSSLNSFRINKMSSNTIYEKQISSLGETNLFFELSSNFDSIFKTDQWIQTFNSENLKIYKNYIDTLKIIDSAMAVIHIKNHIPISHDTWAWMDSTFQYQSVSILRLNKNDVECIHFLSDTTKGYKIINCNKGFEKDFDRYYYLINKNISDFSLKKINADAAEIDSLNFQSTLKPINLVFGFTEGCLPCHWFINESKEWIDSLLNHNIGFYAISSYSSKPKSWKSIKKNNTIFNNLFIDINSNMNLNLKINSYPIFLVVDKNGFVLDYLVGYGKGDLNEIKELLKKYF